MKNRGLGKGLDALFSEASYDIGEKSGDLQTLRISDIEPDKNQPRKNFEPEALASLADSILQHGILQPIVVRKANVSGADDAIAKVLKNKYTIIAGERRWRAAKMAGLSEVPVVIKEMSDKDASAVMLVENLQREDLNDVEKARGMKRLLDEFELTQEETARAVGISRSALANTLRLLTLPERTLSLLQNGEISAGHARALLAIEDKKTINEFAQTIVKKHLSVRDTERAVKLLTEKKAPKKITKAELSALAYIESLEGKMSSALGRKTKIVSKNTKKGKLEIEYYGREDLEALVKLLCGNNIFEE